LINQSEKVYKYCNRVQIKNDIKSVALDLQNGVHGVVVVVLEGFDGLGTGTLAMIHDHSDGFGIHTFFVEIFLVVLGVFSFGGFFRLFGLLEFAGFSVGQVLVEVLHLGFAENDVGVFVTGHNHDFRAVDEQEEVLGFADSHAIDALESLHSHLLEGFLELLFAARLFAGFSGFFSNFFLNFLLNFFLLFLRHLLD